MRSVLAADLGGTKCRFGLVDEDGGVHGVTRVHTTMDVESLLVQMLDAFAEAVDRRPAGVEAPHAVGVGTAGIIAPDRKTVQWVGNLPLTGFPLGQRLEAALGVPATVVNDGRASAMGESRFGLASGRDPLLALFFGTGIGIGLVVDGQPYGGAANAAGEIGHLVFRRDGLGFSGGRRGSYEAYCGGGPMARRAAERLGEPPVGHRDWNVAALLETAREGPAVDPRRKVARQILDEAAEAASIVTANACTLLNPAALVLGGGVISAWPQLFGIIEGYVRLRCRPAIVSALRFVPSQGGSDAILQGAAAAADAATRG